MQINTQLAKAFNRAVTTAENINNDGSINWNFVDADCYMDLADINSDLPANIDYIEQFDYLADCYTGKVTLADRLVTA
jgi:hypothetical protein|tara:strand:+ start:1719 stop:1952 length:234 start_codon:yes stop_codon:yes gene_type:complete